MMNDAAHYHIEVRGSGDETLLLLHGFTGSGTNWAAQVSFFADYFRVVTIDLLGHGATNAPTDPARYAIDRQAADILGILDSLEVERAHLLGYSMGGRLALYTALAYPQRIERLILESASPGLAAARRTPSPHRPR